MRLKDTGLTAAELKAQVKKVHDRNLRAYGFRGRLC